VCSFCLPNCVAIIVILVVGVNCGSGDVANLKESWKTLLEKLVFHYITFYMHV